MMKLKSAAVFAVAVGVFLAGATYRFHDSAHAIGRLSTRGGEVNHPVVLDEGNSRYTIIVTGMVAPSYRGDARVTLEGDRSMKYRIHNSGPVIDLGFFRRPQFRENTLYDLRGKDKVALWVVMRPNENGGTAVRGTVPALSADEAPDCCDVQSVPSQRNEQGAAVASHKHLSIAFRDVRTGEPLLNVPIVFKGREESDHGTK